MRTVIEARRSIRKFQEKPVSRQDIEDIIQCGLRAPSSKNRQPWEYTVVSGKAKTSLTDTFRRGIAREESEDALLPGSRKYIEAAKYTVQIMEQAPAVILAVNPLGKGIFAELSPEERVYEICNVQSLAASVQNMLLAATEKGIGSLWICDIFFAYKELCEWLGGKGELLAAIALGWPDEAPKARPQKSLEEKVRWLE